jgi:hypothetical protein
MTNDSEIEPSKSPGFGDDSASSSSSLALPFLGTLLSWGSCHGKLLNLRNLGVSQGRARPVNQSVSD